MTSQQEDRLTMYLAVCSNCEKYRLVWSTNTLFSSAYNQFVVNVTRIEQNRDAQEGITSAGPTWDKKSKRTAMTEQTSFFINRLQSYANASDNLELLAKVNYSNTKLKKARDTDIKGICSNILALVKENKTALEPHGVTAEMITLFETAITAYADIVSSPKSAKSIKKTATENLVTLFKDTESLLTKRMDLDIELFRSISPDFYSQYHSSRKPVPNSGRITAVNGMVTLASTNQPIKGVTFTFTNTSNALMTSVVKKSADKGRFRISRLPEGTYKVVIKKLGFKTQELTIDVVNGETTNLNVTLEKINN